MFRHHFVLWKKLQQLLSAYADWQSLIGGRYVTHYQYEEWRGHHDDLESCVCAPLKQACCSDGLWELVVCLQELFKNPRTPIDKRNRQFVEREIIRHDEFLNGVEKYPLTPMQKQAVVIDENNTLVLAGAGTGKTSTIMGKVGYLLRTQAVKPSEILVLAFTRKAMEEADRRIKEKFGESVAVRTFHSMGLEIVSKVEGKKPSLSPTAEDPMLYARTIQSILDEVSREPLHAAKLAEFFACYLFPYRPPFSFSSLYSYGAFLQSHGVRTLIGELVKSLEEAILANWFYLRGVNYEYERPYEHDTATPEFRQYRPDFYIKDHRIYVEHFGVGRSGETAPWVDSEKYHRDMEWKRKTHAQHGTVLVETYSYERVEGTLFSNLEKKLSEHGVRLGHRPTEEALEKARGQGAFTLLARLLGTFLNHFKSGQHNLAELCSKARAGDDSSRARAFLDIFEPVLAQYQRQLESRGELDFGDMIAQAAKHVVNGDYTVSYKRILVDEFQDISVGRYRLLKGLLDQVPDRRLFCVGDDWQSIYRFAGSDLSVMLEFEKHFGFSADCRLDRAFRFSQELMDVSAKFILKNKQGQLSKTMSCAEKLGRAPVHVQMVENDKEGPLAVEEILDTLAATAPPATTVFLLGRYNFNKPKQLGEWQRKYPQLEIEFITAHSAKGLEADHVIILDLKSGKHGFPTGMADDPLLDLVLAERQKFPHAEERRLFYVALTRARKHVYLVAPWTRTSTFVSELMEDDYRGWVTTFGDESKTWACPVCQGGVLVRRTGKRGIFYGCTTYPVCTFTASMCDVCQDAPLLPTGDSWKCAGGACGGEKSRCPVCQRGTLVQRNGRHGPFLGCTSYPYCKYTVSVDEAPIAHIDHPGLVSSRGPTSLKRAPTEPAVAAMILDQRRSELIRHAVRAIARSLQPVRPERAFSDEELSLGLVAYVLWLASSLRMTEQERQYWFGAPNESARRCAIEFVDLHLADDAARATVKKRFPGFQPQVELQKARNKYDDPAWRVCLTRAVIIVCRALAYAHSGIQEPAARFPEGTVLPELRDAGVQWVRSSAGNGVADQLGRYLLGDPLPNVPVSF